MGPLGVGVSVVAAAALFGASAGVQWAREQRYPLPTVSRETMYLTSPRAIGHLTKGFNALAADLYWIRTIQYFGGIRLGLAEPHGDQAPFDSRSSLKAGQDRYELLYPMLDLTTSLDPLFNIAYRFGAVFLAEPFPGGAGRPDLAISLLEKGLRARADKWEYMWDIGFVHYWWREDYQTAAPGRHDAGRRGRSPAVQGDVGVDPRVGRGRVPAPRRGAQARAASGTR
jgi:hypothetical protein